MKTWSWFSWSALNDNFEKISSLSRILTFQMQMLILGDIFRCAVYYLAETLMSGQFLDEEYVAKASVINPGDWKLKTFRDGLFFVVVALTEFCICINEF